MNIFKLESDIQLLMDRLRIKEGQINVLRFAPSFVLIPNWKRSVETNTETLHLTEASSQTETQRTHEGQNHHTRSSANQQCHACVKYRDSHMRPSYTDRRNICVPVHIQFPYTRAPRCFNLLVIMRNLKTVTRTSRTIISSSFYLLFYRKCVCIPLLICIKVS